MRWFSAFFVTLGIAGIAGALFYLRGQELPYLSPALISIIPFSFRPSGLQVIALFAVWSIVRAVLQRVLAYTEAETEASPRRPSHWRSSLGTTAFRLFYNPTGVWLAFYAMFLDIAVIVAFPLWRNGIIPALAWGCAALYAATVTSAMLLPDRPQLLNPDPRHEQEPDPILLVP